MGGRGAGRARVVVPGSALNDVRVGEVVLTDESHGFALTEGEGGVVGGGLGLRDLCAGGGIGVVIGAGSREVDGGSLEREGLEGVVGGDVAA